MSWYLNVTRNLERSAMADGTKVNFPPQRKIWIPHGQVSADMQKLINKKVLRYCGGDGKIITPPPSAPTVVPVIAPVATTVESKNTSNTQVVAPAAIKDSKHDNLMPADVEKMPGNSG